MSKMKSDQMSPIVLAVNDEPKVLELLTVLLEHEGYKVLTAGNGQRALELAVTMEPDIVVSDVVMPEMDGLEFCRRLEQAADIIYTRDMEGRLTSINEAGARFFGRPTSELVGAPLSALLGEEAAA